MHGDEKFLSDFALDILILMVFLLALWVMWKFLWSKFR